MAGRSRTVSDLLSRVSGALRPARELLLARTRPVTSGAQRMWRRSLQLRVVTITLVASGLLVGGFAYMVASQSTNILLDRAREDVQRRLTHGRDYAAEQMSVHPQYFDPQVRVTFELTVSTLAGGDPDQVGGVVVVMAASGYPLIQSATSPAVDASGMISDELARHVGSGAQAHQIRTGDLGEGRLKYLVYGSPVPTKFGQVELYYLVPLTTQDQAANQIRATVLITGLALVMLLGLLAALVTRLVVTPVRVAARTAQRLSAGLLDQRMVVDGEDDLAMLAASFNQMATNLQRQITRLEEMSRLQRRFTSDVSHELRTPLTTVRMAADLLFAERDGFDPAAARSAELLQTELDRFESLLTDLLEISRFDAGFAVLDAEPTDLVSVVRRVADRLDGLAARLGVRIELRLPATPVIAEVDPRRVERVLRNLVGNAVEHGEGRPVVVTLGVDDAAVAVTVRDHGVGLRAGEDKLVFNRFWRADPSRARQTGGTGLGLSISVEDARLHGGWLEAWGAPGEGAQFRLTLPARAGDRLTSSPLRLVPEDRRPPSGGSDSGSDGGSDGADPDEPWRAPTQPAPSAAEPVGTMVVLPEQSVGSDDRASGGVAATGAAP